MFAPDSKAHFLCNSQSGELLNYKKNTQFLKLYYASQQLPLVSTTAPFLPSLLLFVHSSVCLSGHHSFPEQLPCWHPTPDVAALLARIPPISTVFLSSPWRYAAISGSPCLLSYARFPHNWCVFQEPPGTPVNQNVHEQAISSAQFTAVFFSLCTQSKENAKKLQRT